jgi:D-alanine-D-alanine ligase
MRVVIVYNLPSLSTTHPEAASERAIEDTVAAVKEYLVAERIDVSLLGVGRDRRNFVDDLKRYRPDLVFNLFEGLADDPLTEACVARAIESARIPMTGCSSRSLGLAADKCLTKRLLAAAGLPTPESFAVDSLSIGLCRLRWPLIAKPSLYDASVGIEEASVVTDQWQLASRIDYLLSRYRGRVLVEEFIAGPEFSVAVIELAELRALPAMEYEFVDHGAGRWPLLTYDAKWSPESPDYRATPLRYGAILPERLTQTLNELACQAFRALDCRHYARVDMRVCPSGQPYVLEVNANPDLNPNACFAGALVSGGWSHAEFVLALVHAALSDGAKHV